MDRAFCEHLVERLPAGFTFERIVDGIALYRYADRAFVYVPGGEVELGFDPSGWTPNDDELASYADSASEYGLDSSIHAHLAHVLTKPRRARIASLMVEVETQEPGWIAIDEAQARERMGDSFDEREGDVTVYRGGEQTQAYEDAHGVRRYRASSGSTHADIVRSIEPFRLPTSDEWEHLCGGGARTLFRWGDHAPCDLYPTDVSRDEAAWRRAWVMSMGKLERPAEGFEHTYRMHTAYNGHGLAISGNPYHAELTADPAVRRGGDGGCAICGGSGFFLGWLTLATAYYEPELMSHDPADPIDGHYARMRRVLTVDDAAT
ncbi:MAG: hypothetical protein RIF41_11090 [Polyangiaceae bacterium]